VFSFFLNSTNPTFAITSASNAITVGWQHVAVTRSGNVFRMFLNGVEQGTSVTSTASMYSSKTPRIGAWTNYTSRDHDGYIDDLRITKGVARYTAGFTPPSAELPASIGGDASYNSVSLLLRNGSVGSAPIDESPSPKTITAVGNANNSTSVYKYGSSSMIFDGAGDSFTAPSGADFDFGTGDFTVEFWVAHAGSPDNSTSVYKYGSSSMVLYGGPGYISTPKNTGFEFGTGDFTIECWVRLSSTGIDQTIVGYGASNALPASIAWGFEYYSGAFRGYFYSSTTQYVSTSAASVSANIWYHLAFVRRAGSIVFYVDGIPNTALSAAASINAPASSLLVIGAYYTSLRFLNGYIDDLRITKGVARYTAAFTPPTAELPNL
jgi:hypothetical protein